MSFGSDSPWAQRAVAEVAARSTGEPLNRALPVTLNFHPERRTNGATVLQGLATHGVYRSQFETGTSNGGMTAYPGGDRWRWEQRVFNGAYDDAPQTHRPKYGALNFRNRSIGAAPRFGSAHFRLSEPVMDRTTFCFPDSVGEPDNFGVAQSCDLIKLAAEFSAVPRTDLDEATVGGALDDYIEAHVHGPILLNRDVEAVVLDPSFRGTAIEEQAFSLGVPVEWHEGRVLDLAELERHPQFRGPDIVKVARRVAQNGTLNARIIGDSVEKGGEVAQDLKKVWHYVARFGSPLVLGQVPN